MVTASLISRLSQAVDLIEQRSSRTVRSKVVKVRRGLEEDPDAALDRHFAAHPEDRDANIVIFDFTMMRKWPPRARIAPRRAQTAEFKDRDP